MPQALQAAGVNGVEGVDVGVKSPEAPAEAAVLLAAMEGGFVPFRRRPAGW